MTTHWIISTSAGFAAALSGFALRHLLAHFHTNPAPAGSPAIPRSTNVTFKDMIAEASKTMTAVEHAAMHLVSVVANGDANLAALTADHPLIAEAIAAGTAAATAHGIPVLTIEQTVIALAKEMSAVMGNTAAATPAAPAA